MLTRKLDLNITLSILGLLGLWGIVIPTPVQAVVEQLSLPNQEFAETKQIAQKAFGHASRTVYDPLATGRNYYKAGQFAEAAVAWSEAVENYGVKGDYLKQVLSLSYLSLAYQELSQWDVAEQKITESLKLLQSAPETDALIWAKVLNTQGKLLLYTGQAETALETWEKAQEFYEQAGYEMGALGSKINQAQALQSLGFYRRSKGLLEEINQQLAAKPDSVLKASGLRSLGLALQMVGDFAASQEVLGSSLAIAKRLEAAPEISAILLSLGNTAAYAGDTEAALNYFQQAEETALNPLDRLQARLNLLRLFIQSEQWQQVNTLVGQIQRQLRELPATRASIYGTVNLAANLDKIEPEQQPLNSQELNQLLVQAVKSAKALKDRQAEAYALREWGKLYGQQGQLSEAIRLTKQSLTIAQSIDSTDIIYQAAWQLGQLFKQQQQPDHAVAAYTEAVNALKSLRGDLVAINPDLQFSFRESVEPVYREFVALLLEGTPTQADLAQARELIESLQLAELDNYFHEACLDTQTAKIDEIDPNATVIYPIILPDRLAVIVSAPGKSLDYYSTPIPAAEVENTLRTLLSYFHPVFSPKQRLPLLQQVYDWLIRPAEANQTLANSKTLVFVLDGKFRRIPMAALHDGEQFLVAKYNLSLSIGLQLLEPQPLRQQQWSMVTAGLSEARQGFRPLPSVKDEIEQITRNVSGSVLVNQEFTRSNFAREMNSKRNVVHLATHGQFSSNAEDTFLLTWEGRINVKELDQVLRSRAFVGEGGIDLLVLSACQTAIGDDRAVLGLAGFAVRSGARSTIGSLWSVRDDSTAIFMTKFYDYLQQPGITKAEALRKAQLDLMVDPNFNEPVFWAPFVLVGNWL
ncbi:CHAT domain-containing protein [Moorena producens]|uniref:CHAT domain-containing protein n=1 Tax=Moorena producens TaxID=1155739 RepID=UPI003C7899E4